MRISIVNEHGATTYVDTIAPSSNNATATKTDETTTSNDFSKVLENEQANVASANNSASANGAAAANSTTGIINEVPESLKDIFNEAASTYGVDVNLLAAIAKQESNFRPDAVSSAGAIGVMQLMPKTAQGLGVTDPYDAKQNIMGGAKYIKQMLDRYDGDVTLALAAYNAGSGNVKKYGGVPPFKETQNYVAKVTNYYQNGVSIPDATYNVTNSAAASQNSSTDDEYMKMLYETQALVNKLIADAKQK